MTEQFNQESQEIDPTQEEAPKEINFWEILHDPSPTFMDKADASLVTINQVEEEGVDDLPTINSMYTANLNTLQNDSDGTVRNALNQSSVDYVAKSLASLAEEEYEEEDLIDTAEAYVATKDGVYGHGLLDSYALRVSEAPTETAKWAIVQEYTARIARDIYEDQSGGETFLRTLQMFIPFVHLKDTVDITGGEWTNFLDNTTNALRKFQALSAEDKLVFIPMLAEHIYEATDGSGHRTSAELMRFITNDDSRKVELLFEGLNIAAVAGPVAALAKMASPIKLTASLGNFTKAGKLNSLALRESAVGSEALGTETMVAAINTSPFKFQTLIPEATDGIAAETVAAVNQARTVVQQELNMLDDIPLRGIFREEEERVIQGAWIKNHNEAIATLNDKNMAVSEATLVASDETSFIVEYTVRGAKSEKTIKKQVYYTKDDAGFLDELDVSETAASLASPSVWMDRIWKGSVDKATNIGFTEGAMLQRLHNAAKKATLKDTTKRDAIDAVLLAGDDAGEVYTIAQLKGGVATHKGKIILESNEEIASYYSHRDIFDALWSLKNNQVVAKRRFMGDVGVRITGKPVKGKATPEYTVGAKPVEHHSGAAIIFDADTKKLISPAQAGKLVKEGGYKRVMLDNPVSITKEHGEVIAAIVPTHRMANFPNQGLNTVKGYVPRSWEGVHYAARVRKTRLVNGREVTEMQTIRFFDNAKEAAKFEAKHLAENPKSGIVITKSNERPVAEIEEELVNNFGGMFGTSRSNRKVLMGMNGDEPVRHSAMKALDTNINHISNAVPMNNFRMGLISTWSKSAKKYLANPENPMGSSFLDGTPRNVELALTKSREWLKDQLRIPSESERRWTSVMRNVGEWMEGGSNIKGINSVRKWVMDVSAVDPYSAMRAAAFHPTLGWFNFSQFLVQSQGAVVALSLHPTLAPKLLGQTLHLRAAIQSAGNPAALAKIAKAAGVEPKAFAEMVEQYNKSGLFQSLKSTADYNAAAMGYSIDAGAISRMADKGLVFFREGENFARSYSWLLARHKWLESGKKIATQADLDAITTESVRYTFNLNRANRAHWQKGALSIPTQFWQINAKFVENMLPNVLGGGTRKFTGLEKTKIMLGQGILFGGAGIPMAGYLNEALDSLLGDDHKMSEVEVQARRNGLYGVAQELIFDENLQGSGRLSLMQGVRDAIISVGNTIDGDPPEFAKLFGVFGGAASRTFDTVAELAPYFASNTDLELSVGDLTNVANSVGDVLVSYSNMHKAAIWWRMQGLTDKKGNVLYELEGDQWPIILAKALGFSPDKMNEIFEISSYNRQLLNLKKEATDAVITLYMDLARDVKGGEKPSMVNFIAKRNFMLSGLNKKDQADVLAAVGNRLANPRDTTTDNWIEAVYNRMDTGATVTQQGQSSISANSIMNEGL